MVAMRTLPLELKVIRPADQLVLCDVFEGRADGDHRHAADMMAAIELTRRYIAGLSVTCIGCGVPVLNTRGLTYCVARASEATKATTAVVCADCTEDRSPDQISAIASTALMHRLVEQHGGTVAGEGHA